jgi:ribosomal protein S18 acetylase RimI-like enzyme
MVTVRPATVADAPAMGQLVVRAWQAAYRGQMPDDYLNGLRAEERAAYWDGVLRREDRRGVILVAERDGEVVGFAAAGPSPDPQGAGELYAINVDPDHWGGGGGRALLGAAQAELDRMGLAESVLWVLPGNARARRFYERAGWAADGTEKTSEAFGVSFDEVRYRRRSTSEAISSATPAGTE